MTNTLDQIEKNVQASFGYVKKDLLMLNDTVSDLQTKINHLSLNHAALLEKIAKLEKKLSNKKKTVKSKTVKKRTVKRKRR